ncbi:alpha-ketoacid dehydrogenase subunit beta [Chloroflexota bacterium]
MKVISFAQAILEALDEELSRDPNVFIIGEDIGKAWGGAFGECKGLFDKYGPNRIRETAISEIAIMGAAIGAAAAGTRPVVDLMFSDFLGLTMDDILNHMTKMRYMFGGNIKLPITTICYSGAGLSAGAHHSKCLEGLLMSIPGIKIASPAFPNDAKGLLKYAIRDDNPAVIFIHKLLYLRGSKGPVPENDYTTNFGKAEIKRQGADVTVLATGLMVHRALHAAEKMEQKGVNVEIIDLRTLVPLDMGTIINSVIKTGRLVIMAEETKTGSSAAEIAALVADEGFAFLKAPIKRVCAPDTPVPFSPLLEKTWMPDEDDLTRAIESIV